jgi:hypothetical protein
MVTGEEDSAAPVRVDPLLAFFFEFVDVTAWSMASP